MVFKLDKIKIVRLVFSELKKKSVNKLKSVYRFQRIDISLTYQNKPTMTATIFELVATGKYDAAKINKFHAKQMKVNNNNKEIADAMVRMYKHTFEIREKRVL